jgi:RNA polymerase sigma factor (sigma-70 family)
MDNNDTLARLVRRFKEGDKSAFEQIYQMMHNTVYFLALKYTKNEQDALDAAQNAFMAVFNSIGQLRDEEAFTSWVCRIVYYQCMKSFRKRERVLASNDESLFINIEESSDYAIPGKEAEKRDTRKFLCDIIDNLPNEQSATIVMYYYQQKSVNEIASIMGCSAGTAKSRLNYGRKAIKKSIDVLSKKHGMDIYSFSLAPLIMEALSYSAGNSHMALDKAEDILASILRTEGTKEAAGFAGETGVLSEGAAASKVAFAAVAKIAAVAVILAASATGVYFAYESGRDDPVYAEESPSAWPTETPDESTFKPTLPAAATQTHALAPTAAPVPERTETTAIATEEPPLEIEEQTEETIVIVIPPLETIVPEPTVNEPTEEPIPQSGLEPTEAPPQEPDMPSEPVVLESPEPSQTLEPTSAISPSESPEPTASEQLTPTISPSESPEPTASAQLTPTISPSESSEPTASAQLTPAMAPLESSEPTASAQPTSTMPPSESPEPTASAQPTSTMPPSESPEPTASAQPTSTMPLSESLEPAASAQPTPIEAASPTPESTRLPAEPPPEAPEPSVDPEDEEVWLPIIDEEELNAD